jgi:hypothetical protein
MTRKTERMGVGVGATSLSYACLGVPWQKFQARIGHRLRGIFTPANQSRDRWRMGAAASASSQLSIAAVLAWRT